MSFSQRSSCSNSVFTLPDSGHHIKHQNFLYAIRPSWQPKTFFSALQKFLSSLIVIMSHRMGKPTICIGENKGAAQLRSNCEADQRRCFRHTVSTIPLLHISKVSSFELYAVTVQPSLCRTWNPNCWFSYAQAHI